MAWLSVSNLLIEGFLMLESSKRTEEILLTTSFKASSLGFSNSNSMTTMLTFLELVEVTFLIPSIPITASSILSVTLLSMISALAPG